MNRIKGIAIVVVAVLVTGVSYQTFQILNKGDRSLARVGRAQGRGEGGGGGNREAAPVPVRVSPVERGPVSETLQLTAALAATHSVPLFASQPGIVVAIPVEEGDRVAQGDLLLRLDERELALNLEQARVRLERDEEEWERQREISRQALTERAEYRDAKFAFDTNQVRLQRLTNERQRREREATRIEASFQSQLASEKEWDDARFALDQARFEEAQAAIEFQRAQAEWERVRVLDENRLIDEKAYSTAKFAYEEAAASHALARLRLSQARVAAPRDGVVVNLGAREGDYVSSNTLLMTLEDLDTLEAVVHLPEAHWATVRPGQPVAILPEALRGVEVPGEVVRISPTIDPASGTFKVTVGVRPGGRNQVKPGMFTTLRIRTAERKGALLVPREAVLGEQSERFLFVLQDGAAIRRGVTLGVPAGDQVEIREGVKAGEQVVVVGQYGVKHGTRVAVKGIGPVEGKPAAP